ncbi:hypothetical protein LRS03_26045 [Rhizobacter sp. J219]|uniref:hypothetical protein n=1 Tax=Rhizobacter sp. J219 TaxID=2898430 RepID=UPI002150E7CA|nr:hypothetical protein [Rhizobacter sp. J219]MCR5886128.1 hypothetical protein [Rhizobacter sp. J219]
MNAAISFPQQGVAEIKVHASAFIYSTGTFAMLGGFVVACVMLVQGVLFFQVLAVLLLVLTPLGWREVSKAADRADSTIEINKDALLVKRTVGREVTSKPIGGHLELQLYELNPPGRGNSHIYGLQLACGAGVVRLFGVHSEEEASQMARSLADWLSLPLVNLGLVPSLPFMSVKSLL